MAFKLIINADDFGPIDFINQGIYYHVGQGNLDSAQVLVNMDEGKLQQRLKRLHSFVPEHRTFDLGVHFTLTSGEPIVKGGWGDMLDGKFFKPYQKFHFGYADYLGIIKREFEAQRDRLQKLVDNANTDAGTEKLKVTSVSNHHNLFTIAPDLFETYVDVASSHSNPLKIRSPKARPYETMNRYYELVLPLRNSSDTKEQRQLMAQMNDEFARNNYLGQKELKIPSPHYIDVSFYKDLGSLANIKLREKQIDQRKEKFDDIVKRASGYVTNDKLEPRDVIIEVVFHLGTSTPESTGRKYKDLIEGYEGVTWKYFDNREIEVAALTEMSKGQHSNLIKDPVSWDQCGIITYR